MKQSIVFYKALFLLLTLTIIFPSTKLSGEITVEMLDKMPPMNEIYHPVSTTIKEVQEHFNKGLTYIFAYNHDIAFREFETASKLDPNLAMAYWGMALALGQNVNQDITLEREIRCYNYMQQAIKLAPMATLSEQEYIFALSKRYTKDSSADLVALRFEYRDAMKELIKKYPEDLDAAALYAESILNLDPWKWWGLDGQPKDATLEAIEILEFILMRNPDHIGANHYYIHAWEESPTPQRALASAYRLQNLLPESGHLVHMSCHIFLPTGHYKAAESASLRAIAQDKEYVEKIGMEAGKYPHHYLNHNLYVLTRTYILMEDYNNAIKTAMEEFNFAKPYFETIPEIVFAANTPLEVYLYFHKWNEILVFPLQAKTASAQAYWHYSRATAFAELGDLKSALMEKDLMIQAQKQITHLEEIAKNPASKVLELAAIMLDATIARVKNEDLAYIDFLKKGVELQGKLFYDEPPSWQIPVSQLLGFVYLQQKQYINAEEIFKKISTTLQRNGRTLFGLTLSLRGQERYEDAYWVEREMAAALKHDSSPLLLNKLFDFNERPIDPNSFNH